MKRPSSAKKKKPNKKRTAASLPAKITPPRLGQCYLRKRLFRRLDQWHDKPAVWISGPAGSGKTMLVASYLQERKISNLWYQIDARDVDPATLFYYLGLAAKHHSPRRRKALPLLTPEYLGGMPAFTRNFFEALFERLKPPFALVLDNYQELVEEALLHQVMRDLLAVVPDGGQVVLISRSQPPQVLGRFQVHQQMALLDWHDLQLNVDEVQAISGVVQKTPLTQPEATALQAATLGWAAGVVLMLAQPRADARAIDTATLSAPEAVFDYFAAEILAELDEATRDFLIKSAFLPQISAAIATTLTGHQQAGRILANLARKNYFTLPRSSRPPRLYQYHPLFKAFLQQQAHSLLAADQLKALQNHAATLLMESRQYDEAAELLQSTESWDQLAGLICSQAQDMVVQGRLNTLQGWLQALPQEMFARQPWLHYWLGVCQLFFTPDQSQLHFEHAFAGFKTNQDAGGIYLSWAGVVKTIIYQQTDFRQLDNWIVELEILKEQYGTVPSEEIKARLLTSVLSNLISRTMQYRAFDTWAQQADALWHSLSDINLRLELGCWLMEYHGWIGNFTQCTRITNELIQLAETDDVHPSISILVFLMTEFYYWHYGHNRQALEYMQKALKIAHASGIHIWDCMIWAAGVYAALCLGDLEKADVFLKSLESRLALQPQNLDTAHFYLVSGWRDLIQADLDNAVEHLKNACKITRQVGAAAQNFHCHQGLALALFAKGRLNEARSMLNKSSEIAARLKIQYLEYYDLLIQAYFDLKSHRRKAGLNFLGRALTMAKKHHFSQIIFWQPKVMAFLYTQALENDIEVDYVRQLIRRFNIMPAKTPLESAHWPWPIRIFTLGRFEVRVNDQALAPKRRGQNKPLALLKAIIAFGGRQVSEEQLWDALWPDAEGDAAHVAFTTTLHRLRKLIGYEQAVTLQGHRVGLDPQHCWVDTWRLQELLSQVLATDRSPKENAVDLPQAAEQIFDLYQGLFLAGDAAPWVLGTRERLRTQVLRQITQIAAQCQAQKQWQPAIAIYERGLEIDPLVETFYQGLIQCYQQMERHADALATYERCRKILGEVLEVQPCSDIETLRKQLHNTNHCRR